MYAIHIKSLSRLSFREIQRTTHSLHLLARRIYSFPRRYSLTGSTQSCSNLYKIDKEWTKEETDYLFDVVREYDLRWYIIHDRYDYSGGVPRALEVRLLGREIATHPDFILSQDLKDRYYSVCRKLVRNRPWAGDEASKAQLVSSFQFDKGQGSHISHI